MKNFQTLSEGELIFLYQEGNQDAFAELFKRHSGALRIYIKKINLDCEQVKDISQDVFEKAMKFINEGKFPKNTPFKEWLEKQAKIKTIQILLDPEFVCLNQCTKKSDEKGPEEF